MNAARTIARLGLQEAVRRRVFVIVAVLTVAYLALYGLGTWQAFEEVDARRRPRSGASSPTSSPARRCSG